MSKQNGSIKVERGVPMPTRPPRNKYPWAEMKVGDSFAANGVNEYSFRSQVVQAGRATGRKFSCRKTDEGLRVWRIA